MILLIIGLFFLFFTKNTYAQANSDYLKSLEGEASTLHLDGQTEKLLSNNTGTPNSDSDSNKGGDISRLQPGLTLEQFEIAMKDNYIGSFLFYKRLAEEQKKRVYAFYQANPDPNKIREKILQEHKKE